MTKTLKGMMLALGLAIIPMIFGLVVIIFMAWTWVDSKPGMEKLLVAGLAFLVVAFILLVLFIWLAGYTVYTIVVLVRAATEASVGSIIATVLTLVYNVAVFVCMVLFFTTYKYGIEMSMLLLVLGIAALVMNVVVSLSGVASDLLVNEKNLTL